MLTLLLHYGLAAGPPVPAPTEVREPERWERRTATEVDHAAMHRAAYTVEMVWRMEKYAIFEGRAGSAAQGLAEPGAGLFQRDRWFPGCDAATTFHAILGTLTDAQRRSFLEAGTACSLDWLLEDEVMRTITALKRREPRLFFEQCVECSAHWRVLARRRLDVAPSTRVAMLLAAMASRQGRHEEAFRVAEEALTWTSTAYDVAHQRKALQAVQTVALVELQRSGE